MLDVRYHRIKLGDDVVFIRNNSSEAQPEIRQGTVQKITPKSVMILDSHGEHYRVLTEVDSPDKEETRLKKVAVLEPREKRGGPARDVTGYPVRRGDVVVFRGPVDLRHCKELIAGKVERLTQEYAFLSECGTEKKSRRLISMLAVLEPKQKGNRV